MGQFLSYRYSLGKADSDRKLFLAIPHRAFNSFFETDDVRELREIYSLALLVFNPNQEEIVQWIE